MTRGFRADRDVYCSISAVRGGRSLSQYSLASGVCGTVDLLFIINWLVPDFEDLDHTCIH